MRRGGHGPSVAATPRYGAARSYCNALARRALPALLLALSAAAPVRAAPAPVVLVLGDSLTAGYGLPAEEAFPAQLEQRLRRQGVAAQVVNGGVSGDTTAGGVARLDWMLANKPDCVLLEL